MTLFADEFMDLISGSRKIEPAVSYWSSPIVGESDGEADAGHQPDLPSLPAPTASSLLFSHLPPPHCNLGLPLLRARKWLIETS